MEAESRGKKQMPYFYSCYTMIRVILIFVLQPASTITRVGRALDSKTGKNYHQIVMVNGQHFSNNAVRKVDWVLYLLFFAQHVRLNSSKLVATQVSRRHSVKCSHQYR